MKRPALAALALLPGLCLGYPLDGFEATGIGRLEYGQLVEQDRLDGRKQPAGALLPAREVAPRLMDSSAMELPAADAALSAKLGTLLDEYRDRYAISVLDLSDPQRPLYAEHHGDTVRNPGSVGKILVALGLFQMLADVYPDDLEARRRVLRDTVITADEFIIRDSHTVRFWDPATGQTLRRPLREGDQGRLYEYLDWMMSASSNAAASMVIKQAMLLRGFGRDYPLPEAEADAFFRDTPRAELARLFEEAIIHPVARNGLDTARLRQGSFFTRTGQSRVPGTNSVASAREMLRYLLLMEQGRLVDPFSSTEIKRLMYSTERRIRYASSPALNSAAVYFKSGSLFRCQPEPDFECRAYHGNVMNLMNSVVVVEAPAGERRLYYLVSLMSDVLRRNSAVDHQTLGTRIHRLIESLHSDPP